MDRSEAKGRLIHLPELKSPFATRVMARAEELGIVPPDQLKTPLDRQRQYARMEAAIGHTPLLRINAENGTTIWAKIESANPFSESHYDRATIKALKTLEMEGYIKPGDTILEGTSGSAGRSFAVICHFLGFKLQEIVPRGKELPRERRRGMLEFGAKLIDADESGGVGKVVDKFRDMLGDLMDEGWDLEKLRLEGKPILIFRKGKRTICAPNHSEIPITPRAFSNIAEEVATQLPPNVRIDTFVATLGNGSTLKGISEVLRREYGDDIHVIGVETRKAPTNAIRKLREEVGEEHMAEKFRELYGFDMPTIEQMSYHDSFGASTPGYEPPFIDVTKLHEIRLVGDEWREFQRKWNEEAYGLYEDEYTIGNTSAENLYLAHQLAKEPGGRGRNILVLFYDKPDQYPGWPPLYRQEQQPMGSLYEAGLKAARRPLYPR